MLCSVFAPTEIAVMTDNHKCSVHCLLCDRCQDGEPRVLCSLFALRSLSRRRTTSALFIVCSVIVVTTENHECSVHCLLCDRCQDGEPRVLCSLFALRSLSRRRITRALFILCAEIVVTTVTTSALFIVCSDRDLCHDGEPRVLCSLFAPTEIAATTENHECSVHCLL